MTTHILLTRDESIALHTRALHRLTRQLRSLHLDTITAVITGHVATLNETHRTAYTTYQRAVNLITADGHGDILDDERDGYLSALHANDTNEPARLRHAA